MEFGADRPTAAACKHGTILLASYSTCVYWSVMPCIVLNLNIAHTSPCCIWCWDLGRPLLYSDKIPQCCVALFESTLRVYTYYINMHYSCGRVGFCDSYKFLCGSAHDMIFTCSNKHCLIEPLDLIAPNTRFYVHSWSTWVWRACPIPCCCSGQAWKPSLQDIELEAQCQLRRSLQPGGLRLDGWTALCCDIVGSWTPDKVFLLWICIGCQIWTCGLARVTNDKAKHSSSVGAQALPWWIGPRRRRLAGTSTRSPDRNISCEATGAVKSSAHCSDPQTTASLELFL